MHFTIFTACEPKISNPNLNNTVQFSENEIVLLLKQKNLQGIQVLYDQYGAYIYGFIIQIVKAEEAAELVLQDTFLKVWDNIDYFSREKGRFITWLINIARNAAIDMSRSKNYKQTLKLISLDQVPRSKNILEIDVKMENIDVKDIVSTLAPKYSVIINLIYFKGYTHVEVAKELDIPLGTVKGRVRKAFKDIRAIFES